MYTDKMRVTGLSGIDTDSMVKQLMKAEGLKYDKLFQTKTKMEWKQASYHSVSTSLVNFQNSFLSFTSNTKMNIRSTANFNTYTSTVKFNGDSSSAVTVKASTSGAAGNYKLNVTSVAKADAYKSVSAISSQLTGATEAEIMATIQENDSIKVTLDDATAKEIKFDDAFMAKANNPSIGFAKALDDKLKELFGSDTNGRKVSATTDAKGNLVITAGKGHTASVANGINQGNFTITGEKFAMPKDEDGKEKALAAGSFKITIGGDDYTIEADEILAGSSAVDVAKMLNAKIKEATGENAVAFSVSDGKLVISNSDGANTATIEGSEYLESIGINIAGAETIEANLGSAASLGIKSGGSTALDMNTAISTLFKDAVGPGNKISFVLNGSGDEFLDLDGDMTLKQLMDKINNSSAGVKISFNSFTSQFTMEAKNTGEEAAITFSDENGSKLFADVFGFGATDTKGVKGGSHTEVATSAVFELNGVRTSRESNNFTIDGIAFTLTADAANKEFDISLQRDSAPVVDMLKNFVAEYNKLFKSLNAMVNTSRPKSGTYSFYEPLTDEQKSAMSDKQVEEWEAKAKTGMLYRDNTVNSIMTQMRSMLYEAVDMGDGTKLSLYDMGITTSNKTSESGMLVIDEAKLQKFVDENGDKVEKFFTKDSGISASDKTRRSERFKNQGFADRLNDIINSAVASGGTLYTKAGLTDANIINNDMAKAIKDQNEKLSEMLKYLVNKETHYYTMFSKLESAINQSNSQMSSLQGMLGS